MRSEMLFGSGLRRPFRHSTVIVVFLRVYQCVSFNFGTPVSTQPPGDARRPDKLCAFVNASRKHVCRTAASGRGNYKINGDRNNNDD